MRYLVVNERTGEVLNAVEWDGVSTWAPPVGFVVHQDKEGAADLGDTLKDVKDLKVGVIKAVPRVSVDADAAEAASVEEPKDDPK